MDETELPANWMATLEQDLKAYHDRDVISLPAGVIRGLLKQIPQTVIVRLGRDEVFVNFLTPGEQRSGRGPAVTSVLYYRREIPSVSVVWRGGE